VRGEIEKIYSKTYYVLQQNQKEVFDQYEKHIAEKAFKLEQAIEKAIVKCNQAAKRAEQATEKLFKLKTWWDLIWYASPIAVLLNFIWRVFEFFAGG